MEEVWFLSAEDAYDRTINEGETYLSLKDNCKAHIDNAISMGRTSTRIVGISKNNNKGLIDISHLFIVKKIVKELRKLGYDAYYNNGESIISIEIDWSKPKKMKMKKKI